MSGKTIANPSDHVPWWDYTYETPILAPTCGSLLPCGCYIRRTDYQAVLCDEHLSELNAPLAAVGRTE